MTAPPVVPHRAAPQGNNEMETGESQLDELLSHHPLPTWRFLAWPVMILLTLALSWANFSKLDEVAVAKGVVAPKGQVKLIQHLEGGIIQAIYVSEGDIVKKGTTLISLNLATSGVNRKELQVRLDNQILVKARLEAETRGTKLIFPKGIAKRRPIQAAAENMNLKIRRRQLRSSIQVLKQTVTQRQQDVKEKEAKLKSLKINMKLVRERFKLSTSLLAEGLTPKMEHLKLQAEVESLDGKIKSLKQSLSGIRSAVAEARGKVKELSIRFQKDAQAELVKAEQAIGRIKELLAQATEQRRRSNIKSPVNGIVQNMLYNTIGAVVKPGEVIMQIVPVGGGLVIDAKLNPTDRGYVNEGMKALIKISTYNYSRYGGLNGRVSIVAPDVSKNKKGNPYFRMIVDVDKTYFGRKKGELPILPGMQATVNVHTGTKSVMEYLIQPVLKLKDQAFRGR
jgi:adhesin transport system membrane fusion protein